MTRFTDTVTVDLPADLPVEDLTRKTSLEKKEQTTEYYLGEQLLAVSHAEVCPTLTLPEFLETAKSSPANTARAAAQSSTADQSNTSAGRTPKTSSSSLGDFFRNSNTISRTCPNGSIRRLFFW